MQAPFMHISILMHRYCEGHIKMYSIADNLIVQMQINYTIICPWNVAKLMYSPMWKWVLQQFVDIFLVHV